MLLAAVRAHKGEDTLEALWSARDKAASIGSGHLEVWAYLTAAGLLEGRGSHEFAIAAGQDGLARARQLGLARQVAAPIAGKLAESLTSAGRWDEALEILDEVLSLDQPPLGRAHPLLVEARSRWPVATWKQRNTPSASCARARRPACRGPVCAATGPAGDQPPACHRRAHRSASRRARLSCLQPAGGSALRLGAAGHGDAGIRRGPRSQPAARSRRPGRAAEGPGVAGCGGAAVEPVARCLRGNVRGRSFPC